MNRDREKVRFTWVAPSSTVFFNLWTSSIKGISVSIATGLLRSEESTYIENYVENKGKQKTRTQKDGEKTFSRMQRRMNQEALIKRSNSDLLKLSVKFALVDAIFRTDYTLLQQVLMKNQLCQRISRDHSLGMQEYKPQINCKLNLWWRINIVALICLGWTVWRFGD